MKVDYMEYEDLDAVEAIQHAIFEYEEDDPEFGLHKQLRDAAWSKDDFIAAVKKNRSKVKGEHECRAMVAFEAGEGGEREVHGVYVVELQDGKYETRLFSLHPNASDEAAQLMLKSLFERARKSPDRRVVRITVSDWDYGSLKPVLAACARVNGKVEPNRADGTWTCEWQVARDTKKSIFVNPN